MKIGTTKTSGRRVYLEITSHIYPFLSPLPPTLIVQFSSVAQSRPTLCNPMVARLFCPWDFPGKNNWSGLPFLSSEDLPDPGIKSVSPALAGRFLSLSCLESSSFLSVQFSSVQLLSRVQLFATRWITACQASLCITNSRSSPKLMSIESLIT